MDKSIFHFLFSEVERYELCISVCICPNEAHDYILVPFLYRMRVK